MLENTFAPNSIPKNIKIVRREGQREREREREGSVMDEADEVGDPHVWKMSVSKTLLYYIITLFVNVFPFSLRKGF